jgi:hypothetical protein
MKKLLEMLPTMNVMASRHGALYPNRICQVCHQDEEDNDHLWHCPTTTTVQHGMWQEAMGHINQWGHSATSKANAKVMKQFEANIHNNKPVPAQPVQYQW